MQKDVLGWLLLQCRTWRVTETRPNHVQEKEGIYIDRFVTKLGLMKEVPLAAHEQNVEEGALALL